MMWLFIFWVAGLILLNKFEDERRQRETAELEARQKYYEREYARSEIDRERRHKY